GGWGADGKQTDGAVRYRITGRDGAYDSPELGRAKSEAEWWKGQDAKAFLKWNIEQAHKLVLKETGQKTPHGDPVAILYIDGRDAKDLMIDAGLGKLPAGWSGAHMVRPKWDEAKE